MFQDAKKAGLLPSDIAKLMRVSRVTASLWFNGHQKPHHLLMPRIEAVLAAIDQAVAKDELPVPYEITQRERGLYIRTTLNKYLKPPKTPDLG